MLNLLDRTIYVNHVQALTGRKFGYSTGTGTLYKAHVQPASNEEVQAFDGQIGQVFGCFVDMLADIREGDRVTDRDTLLSYKVRGLKTYQMGSMSYKKLILARDNNE